MLALGLAALCFYRALRGHRDGRARLDIRGSPSLEADRDDDPVGYATAVWGNAAMGMFALACIVWLIWVRPAPHSPTAANIEQAGLCSAPDAARPVVHVRNLACQPGTNGRQACNYEAMTGTEAGPWVRTFGAFQLDRRTQKWCFAQSGATG